jgi:predicted RecB family nuclease
MRARNLREDRMLPEGFVLSQSSLQDYVDCPRRFQLRYLEHCRWPAPETADALEFERSMQSGHAFHRLMRQLYSGVPRALLEPIAATDVDLRRWWANYCDAPPPDLPQGVQEAEATLATTLCTRSPAAPARVRLEARYDLLTGMPGERWTIVDWKTGRKRATRGWLQSRLQTRIYPLVLVRGGATFNAGQPIAPESVEMLYWFAEFPAQPERFIYSADALAADESYLEGLLADLIVQAGEFPKTPERRLCRFCVYRSLCWEDVQAGLLAEAEDVEAAAATLEELDLDAIAPIPF